MHIRVLDGPDVRDQQGISAYFVQMGQFIDHDITLSPELEGTGGLKLVCVILIFDYTLFVNSHLKECCDYDSDGSPWKFPIDNDQPDKCSPIQA